MSYITKLLFISIYLLGVTTIYAQEHHHHLENEIGLSTGAVYSFEHKEWGTGVHIHYFRMLGEHSKWSLGAEVESVWSDGNHYTIGAGVKYEIIDRLNIGLLPGITFLKHHDETHTSHTQHDDSKYESLFSLHVEVVYDLFHWEHFHLGPAVDYSWTKNDPHCAIGVHAAYCF